MRFLMLVCADDSRPITAAEDTVEEWLASTTSVRIEGHQLCGKEDATTVRDYGAVITDGPFADTKEWIAGYDILDCADLREAIGVAARHPMARFGAIELRPYWEE